MGSGRHERQMRRETTRRKGRPPVSLPELVRRFPVRRHEPAVGFPELLPDLPRRGMDERCWRAVQGLGPGLRSCARIFSTPRGSTPFFARSTAAVVSIWQIKAATPPASGASSREAGSGPRPAGRDPRRFRRRPLVGLLSQRADHRLEVLQIPRKERNFKAVGGCRDQAVHHVDVMTEAKRERLAYRPVEIQRQDFDPQEMPEKLDGSFLILPVRDTIEDLEPDNGAEAKRRLSLQPRNGWRIPAEKIDDDRSVKEPVHLPRRSS